MLSRAEIRGENVGFLGELKTPQFPFQISWPLKNTGALQWFYEELKHLSEQQFHQKDKERPINFASVLALWMHMYPPKNVLGPSMLVYSNLNCFHNFFSEFIQLLEYASPKVYQQQFSMKVLIKTG